jgi:uncharacterized delta-60 repeat protein
MKHRISVLSLFLLFVLHFTCATQAALVADNTFRPANFAKAAAPGRALLLPDAKYVLFFSLDTLTDQSTGPLVRFLADGTLDSSFSFSREYKEVVAAAAGPNGKLYIAATRYAYNVFESEQILRLNADGSIDSSFAPATVGSPDTFPDVQQIVVQPDGRILVVGVFLTFAGNNARQGIVRLMPDGSVDSSFAPVTVNGVYCAALQSDGKVLIGGSFSTVNSVAKAGVARLNADGSLDSTFQPTGYTRMNSRVRSIVIQPDGQIVISGNFRVGPSSSSPRMPVIRLSSTGTVDAAFNSTGLVQTITTGRDLVLQPNGKILAVINASVYRLNSDGTKDTSFRQPVVIDATLHPPSTPTNSATPPGTPVTLQLYSDGRILMGGLFTDVDPPAAPNYAHFGVVRLDSAGNVDSSLVSSHRTGQEIAPSSFVRLSDSSGLVTFDDTVDAPIAYNVARLLSDGTRDQNFTLSSSDPSRFLIGFSARTIRPLPDGKFFVYGFQDGNFPSYGKVDAKGVEDTTFASNHLGLGSDITILPDGKILFAAGNDPQVTVYGSGAVLKATGELDAPGGPVQGQVVRDPSTGTLSALYVGSQYLAVQPDGSRLFQYLSQDQKFHLIGFTGNGAPAEVTFPATELVANFPYVFDPNSGTALQPPAGAWSATAAVQDAYVQADGRAILVGHFTSFGSTPARGIVRVERNGAVDSTFNVGGGMQWTTTTETAAFFPTIENIEPTADGKFLITGTFEAFNGTPAPGIARLNADGSVDTSFVAPVHRDKRSRTKSAFKAQPDGSFLLSGPYIVGNETTTRSLIRLINPQPAAVNISTRLGVGTDENVLIEGFIVDGPAGSSKKILVRAIGPSLSQFGISDPLANPTLEIHDASSATVATNNDWKTTQLGGIITANQFPEINGSGLAPKNDLESAIVASLAPGSYTAVVRGAGNSIGTGVVDAFDLDAGSNARLVNIATRGLVQPDDKLMIAGFIVQNGAVKIVVRAIGPSLVDFGISNALPDTTVQLRDQQGAVVIENDDWKTGQPQELQSLGLQPSHNLEAALVATIPAGQYTAQVRGKGTDSGIGVVQVYFLQ